jgi:nucleoside-diphosphate-sugar epimerase
VADSPVETMETESIGMRNVAHAAVECGIDKLIYASTSGVYGHSAIEKSFTETIQLDPRTSYAIAKRFNEIYLAAMYDEKGLDSISIRFFNVYGPGQDNRMVVPRFFEQALSGRPITVFGDGKQTRDFTHIDDSVTACVRLAELGPGCEVFNIANEHEETIGRLAELIQELADSGSAIEYVAAPPRRYDFEVERRVGNSEKLARAIGFKPTIPLRDGLERLVAHYRTTIGSAPTE